MEVSEFAASATPEPFRENRRSRRRFPSRLEKGKQEERDHRDADEGADVVELAPFAAPGAVCGREVGEEEDDERDRDAAALEAKSKL